MPFVFALKTLLRLRELREGTELQTLQALASQVAALRAEIESLDRAGEEQRRELCRDSLDGVSGADLHMYQRRDMAFRERRASLAGKLRDLEKNREEQQASYIQARRERETLSTLQEQQQEIYEQEQSRRTQRAVDELFLVRYVRELNTAKNR